MASRYDGGDASHGVVNFQEKNMDCDGVDCKESLAGSQGVKTTREGQHRELKTQLDEKIALRVQREEEENSEFLKKFSDLEQECSQLQDTISSMTEKLDRASAAVEKSEKHVVSLRRFFVLKAVMAQQVPSLRHRIKSLERQLAAAVENIASLAPLSSLDDANVSFSSPEAPDSPMNETDDSVSVASCDLSMVAEYHTMKLELLQAKEAYVKYREMSVDLKLDNGGLKKELNELKTQSQLAGMSYMAVVVLVLGIFLGMALDSMYHSLKY